MPQQIKKIFVSGATGYVGGRLVPRLLERGYRVVAASRSYEKLKSRNWASHPSVELCPIDILKFDLLLKALEGCWAAYYLVHSMNPLVHDFEKTDRDAAFNMVRAAEKAGLNRLLYLGGLGEDDRELSRHLRSRHEVAGILQSGKVPATVLRAAMIIGSGSASFEILRYLVDRLPVMVTPRWVQTPNQPIAIRNVIDYLLGCLETDQVCGQTLDIGGPQVLTYRELMEIYAEEAGLPRRWIVSVPVLTPRLSSYWIHLVTPVPASIARPLAEGLRNPVVVKDKRILDMIPQELLQPREAIRLALGRLRENEVQSHWTDAGKVLPVEWLQEGDPSWAGGLIYQDERSIEVQIPAEKIWEIVVRIGGNQGWYHADWLWRLRGTLDRLLGGVGLRRGRRDENTVAVGDALDFWRVIAVEPHACLKLAAEMKLPGDATLEFRISAISESECKLTQIARFKPRGLLGILYWWLVYPLHQHVFGGLLNNIARRANARR